jgi:2-oxoglutarate ferredoxin oxidoreductase subunit beta
MSNTATEAKATYKLDAYQSPEYSTWCPGCGDFPILKCLKESLMAQEIGPHQVMIVSGIGCGSKLPYYIRANGYNSLHGRSLPIAQAIKLVNHSLKVVAVTGDGDGLGIGGNHFLHAMRRNPDITHLIENNQIYGLTKGQASPTSDKGFITTTSPDGCIESAVNPIALGITCGATFIARTSSGDPKHLTDIITRAMKHKGYSLIDVLQPCVTFNKVNTYQWYKQRIYNVETQPDYKPKDRQWAFSKALEWGDKIPVGVIYQDTTLPTYEDQVPVIKDLPLVQQEFNGRVKQDAEKFKESFC